MRLAYIANVVISGYFWYPYHEDVGRVDTEEQHSVVGLYKYMCL